MPAMAELSTYRVIVTFEDNSKGLCVIEMLKGDFGAVDALIRLHGVAAAFRLGLGKDIA